MNKDVFDKLCAAQSIVLSPPPDGHLRGVGQGRVEVLGLAENVPVQLCNADGRGERIAFSDDFLVFSVTDFSAAAADLEFEDAARLRDEIKRLRSGLAASIQRRWVTPFVMLVNFPGHSAAKSGTRRRFSRLPWRRETPFTQ